MNTLIHLFVEQLAPSILVWFLVYFALKFRGKIGKLGLMHIVYVAVVSFLGACTRQLFGFVTTSQSDQAALVQEAVISSMILPLLFSLGVIVFAVKRAQQ